MRTDDEILGKIQQLTIEYIGLKNRESKELCKFLSLKKLTELCVKKNHSFEIVMNGKIICQVSKRKNVSSDEFIQSFRYHETGDSMILSKLKKTLSRLWKQNKGYFEWGLLEDFELLRVYLWLLQYDDLSKHVIENLHQTEECLILVSEIFNHRYPKLQTSNQQIDTLKKLMILFNKS
jgi:hypothetical protein